MKYQSVSDDSYREQSENVTAADAHDEAEKVGHIGFTILTISVVVGVVINHYFD